MVAGAGALFERTTGAPLLDTGKHGQGIYGIFNNILMEAVGERRAKSREKNDAFRTGKDQL